MAGVSICQWTLATLVDVSNLFSIKLGTNCMFSELDNVLTENRAHVLLARGKGIYTLQWYIPYFNIELALQHNWIKVVNLRGCPSSFVAAVSQIECDAWVKAIRHLMKPENFDSLSLTQRFVSSDEFQRIIAL